MSVPNEGRAALAREFLRMANQNYREHYAQRVYFATIARRHGLTHREIAEAYGITEGAVRHMLKRAEASN
mgnify:FL=1